MLKQGWKGVGAKNHFRIVSSSCWSKKVFGYGPLSNRASTFGRCYSDSTSLLEFLPSEHTKWLNTRTLITENHLEGKPTIFICVDDFSPLLDIIFSSE